MPKSPTVYVIQQPRPKPGGWVPNLEPATKYGKLEFVFDADDRAYTAPSDARAKLAGKLRNFNPDTDSLLWANFGDPATLWLTIMHLVAGGHQHLRFLYWSRGRVGDHMSNDIGYYFPVELDCREPMPA